MLLVLALLLLVTAAPAAAQQRPDLPWHLEAVGAAKAQRTVAPGALRETVVAVLDTGVAYRSEPPHRRSPGLARSQFVRGFDVLVGRYPHDLTGHGTHVASVIGAPGGPDGAPAGLAPGVRLMPVRVLDANGVGIPQGIARGIREATRRGADVLALALSLPPALRTSEVPDLVAALEEARRRGVVVVASAGNRGGDVVPLPARHWSTIAVGATTERGCGTDSSGYGERIDLVAPGGGADADVPGDPACRPDAAEGAGIPALAFRGFGSPLRILERTGTSFSVAHVAAAVALVRASGVLGADPSPQQLKSHLRATARDIGEPGPDVSYGRGLLDAAAATRPAR